MKSQPVDVYKRVAYLTKHKYCSKNDEKVDVYRGGGSNLLYTMVSLDGTSKTSREVN